MVVYKLSYNLLVYLIDAFVISIVSSTFKSKQIILKDWL